MSAPDTDRRDESLGDLLSKLTSDLGALVRDELQLARVEVTEDVGRLGRAGGMLGGAAFAGSMTLLLMSFAAAWGLSELLPIGLAFVFVGLVWGVAGAALFVVGRQRLREADIKPEQTIETMQENLKWAKQQTS